MDFDPICHVLLMTNTFVFHKERSHKHFRTLNLGNITFKLVGGSYCKIHSYILNYYLDILNYYNDTLCSLS